MKQEIYIKAGLKEVKLNRHDAIKAKCLDCSGFEYAEVNNCEHTKCVLFPYRTGKEKQNAKLRNRAIKDYCLWCMDNHHSEIAQCVSINCPLFNYKGYNRH